MLYARYMYTNAKCLRRMLSKGAAPLCRQSAVESTKGRHCEVHAVEGSQHASHLTLFSDGQRQTVRAIDAEGKHFSQDFGKGGFNS